MLVANAERTRPWLLRAEVPDAIALLDRNTGIAFLVFILSPAVWLAWKVWQKVRFGRLAAFPHITPAELFAALESDEPPLLLDPRGASVTAETGPIRGLWPRSKIGSTTRCVIGQRPGNRHAVRVPARRYSRPGRAELAGTGLCAGAPAERWLRSLVEASAARWQREIGDEHSAADSCVADCAAWYRLRAQRCTQMHYLGVGTLHLFSSRSRPAACGRQCEYWAAPES